MKQRSKHEENYKNDNPQSLPLWLLWQPKVTTLWLLSSGYYDNPQCLTLWLLSSGYYDNPQWLTLWLLSHGLPWQPTVTSLWLQMTTHSNYPTVTTLWLLWQPSVTSLWLPCGYLLTGPPFQRYPWERRVLLPCHSRTVKIPSMIWVSLTAVIGWASDTPSHPTIFCLFSFFFCFLSLSLAPLVGIFRVATWQRFGSLIN